MEISSHLANKQPNSRLTSIKPEQSKRFGLFSIDLRVNFTYLGRIYCQAGSSISDPPVLHSNSSFDPAQSASRILRRWGSPCFDRFSATSLCRFSLSSGFSTCIDWIPWPDCWSHDNQALHSFLVHFTVHLIGTQSSWWQSQ